MMNYSFVEDTIGNTPLVRLRTLASSDRNNIVLAKLEGNNPAGSVKDRAALSMITHAQASGRIKAGDTLIEATSGNTGIALAMVACLRGYKMILLMPENLNIERRQNMTAYGAQLILTPKDGGMEYARDMALQMEARGEGVILNQFSNTDNPLAHFESTGPEIWRDTDGQVTHFVSSMGTTGTITGTGQFLKQQNSKVQIMGVQPADGASIPGIRKWPKEYLPTFFDADVVNRIWEVTQAESEEYARRLALKEGIFCGISSGGAAAVALKIDSMVENSTIVFIVCDRGERYLSTGVFCA